MKKEWADSAARPASSALRSSLATVVPATAAPYGYTLAIWSSGALLLRSEGPPNVGHVLVFAAGAIAGFNVLGLLAIRTIREGQPVLRAEDRVLAGLLDWTALGAVVGAVWGISSIHSWGAWLLAPLTATVLYLVIASLQLAVLTLRKDRNRPDRP